MKRKATIEIEIDTDKIAGEMMGGDYSFMRSSFTDILHPKPGADVKARIAIGKDVLITKNDVLSATAHELGHVLATLFDLPGATENERRMRLAQMFGAPQGTFVTKDVEIKSEQEAWDVAHKMNVPIDAKTEKNAMASYHDGGESFDRAMDEAGVK